MFEEDYLVNQIDQSWSICPEEASIEIKRHGRLFLLTSNFNPQTMTDTNIILSEALHLMSQQASDLWRLLIINLNTCTLQGQQYFITAPKRGTNNL